MVGANGRPPVPFVAVLVMMAALAIVAIGIASMNDGDRDNSAAASVSEPPSGTRHPTPSPSQTALSIPPCARADRPAAATSYADWRRTLVDTTYRLPVSYMPPDLVRVARAGFTGPFEVRAVVIPGLKALRLAAGAAGHPIGIAAAYRSYTDQQALLALRKEQLGGAEALARVARLGHSEHQLGTAIDFESQGMADVDRSWSSTPTGEWMAANAWRFGFVLSYPRRKEALTCYEYEPWHFRYVGRAAAERIHGTGLTLREFLWRAAL